MSGSRHHLLLGVLLFATGVAAAEQKDRPRRPPKEEVKVVTKEKKQDKRRPPLPKISRRRKANRICCESDCLRESSGRGDGVIGCSVKVLTIRPLQVKQNRSEHQEVMLHCGQPVRD